MAIISEAVPILKPASPIPVELLDTDRDVYIQGTISTTAPEFATEVPVTVYAVGSIGTRSVGGTGYEKNASALKEILTVCLAFSGAHSVVGNRVITNTPRQPTDGAVCLVITSIKPKEDLRTQFGSAGAYLAAHTSTIEWLSPIESVPSILIVYWDPVLINGVVKSTNTYTDPTQKIPIEPYSAIESQKDGTKILATEVAFFSFALIQGFIQVALSISKRQQKTPLKINQMRN